MEDLNVRAAMGLDVIIPQIKLRPIESLVDYERNSRTHSKAQIEQLKALMLEFGFTNAVMVDEKGIVAGHGRRAALADLYKSGLQVKFPNGTPIPIGMVPTIDCSGWTAEQRKAYIIADNASALNAGWDENLLALELKELEDAGFDLSLTALPEQSLDELLASLMDPNSDPDRDPEAVPDIPNEPVSVLGDIWICGPHKIGCMDSTSIEAWDRLMGNERADLCLTDPPYNVAYESDLAGKIKNDDMGDAQFREFLLGAYNAMFAMMKPGAPIYVAHADTEGLNFRSTFREAGFKLSGCLIWRKNSLVLGRSDYQWMHEPILYGWKPGSRHRWHGGRKLTTIVEYGENGPITKMADGRYAITVGDQVLVVSGDAMIEEHPQSVIFHEKPSRSELHPTTKPVGLWEKLIRPSGRPGDIIMDPFSGSGNTLIAADRMGLIARVSELDPKFVDVAVRRWEMLTGRRAVHAETGELFPEEGKKRETLPSVAIDLPPLPDLQPGDAF